MKSKNLEERLYSEILKVPAVDIHTHLNPANPAAGNLYKILSYHFVTADLEGAGMPAEKWQSERIGMKERVANMIPYLENCQNTGTYQCVKNLLIDIYGIDNPLSRENWERTYDVVLGKSKDKEWANRVLRDYGNIGHVVVDYAVKADKSVLDPELYSYTREGGALVFDSLLIKQIFDYLGKVPASAGEIDRGVTAYIDEYVPEEVKSVTTGVSCAFDVKEPRKGEVNRILAHGREMSRLTEGDRFILFSYIFHRTMEVYQERGIQVVISVGARLKFYDGKTVSAFNKDTLQNIADVAQRYRKINFFIILCSYVLNQDLALIAKMMPNVIATGYWWHSMYPDYIGRMLGERLDVIPYNKILGFFSDAYMAEWAYGKISVVRKETARILAEKIERGYYTEDLAIDIIKKIFYENANRLYLGG